MHMKNVGTYQPIDSSTAQHLESYTLLALWPAWGMCILSRSTKSPDLKPCTSCDIKQKLPCHIWFGGRNFRYPKKPKEGNKHFYTYNQRLTC